MAGKRKVTPEIQETIVSEWLRWKLGHYPDSTLEDHMTGVKGIPVGFQQMYKYIPDHLKNATDEDLQRYLDSGWKIPLELRGPARSADDGQAAHFLELWAAADADAKAAQLKIERIQATIQAVLDMDPTLSKSTKAALKAQLQ